MDLRQRVLRRSPFVTRTLNAMLGAAVVLFVHAIVRQNLSGDWLRQWPWSWQLLDVQSATAGLLGSVGAVVARAQYARTVQPLLGLIAWVADDQAPGGVLAWASFLTNNGNDAVVLRSIEYRVDFMDPADPRTPPTTTGWVDRAGVIAAAGARGLSSGRHYHFTSTGPNAVLAGGVRMRLAWFAEPALATIVDVYVRVAVLDRVGDLHQRTVSCLVDAERVPTHVIPSPI
ncbi:hypothetical protein ACFV4P_13700 [Kitasatospora sp. NPDC059795]|uniref:hypothetical protein n=1 Tax=Kitasatospora sp. NPDC059795 TaxID=3346949 RepID=UPI003655D1D6